MNRVLALALLTLTTALGGSAVSAAELPANKPARFPPLQLELRIPFQPTAFPSAGHTHLAYELYLTNFSGQPMPLTRIEVLDANASADKPLATFEGQQLASMLQTLGGQQAPNKPNVVEVGPGTIVVAYMWISLDAGTPVPANLRHRVIAQDEPIEGATIGTHYSRVRELGPPVQGSDWRADDAPSNDPDNHHRRGLVVFDATAVISRRYAIDWVNAKGGSSFTGDGSDVHTYYSYAKPVMAVANGTVIAARDGLPDNSPGHGPAFRAAVPLSPETFGGNTVTLDIGGGQYAYYFHMQPGSVRVKVGDRVRKDQQLGQIGCSGDAREPHLHFELTTSARPLAGEGVPYVIDTYRAKTGDAPWQVRKNELPLRNTEVDFTR